MCQGWVLMDSEPPNHLYWIRCWCQLSAFSFFSLWPSLSVATTFAVLLHRVLCCERYLNVSNDATTHKIRRTLKIHVVWPQNQIVCSLFEASDGILKAFVSEWGRLTWNPQWLPRVSSVNSKRILKRCVCIYIYIQYHLIWFLFHYFEIIHRLKSGHL